jgi:hypothetical protein
LYERRVPDLVEDWNIDKHHVKLAYSYDVPAASANLWGTYVRVNGNHNKYNLLTPADEANAVKSAMSGESPMALRLWAVAAITQIKTVQR